MAGISGYGIGTKAGGGDMVEIDGGDFNYDDKVLVETSQDKSYDFHIRPIGAITNTSPKGPQYFCIDPLVDKYLQNNRTRLEMRLRVTRGNGDRLQPVSDVVAPVNLLGTMIWESVVVHVNGQPFPGASNVNAGLKAYIDTMLSTENDAMMTHAQTQLMYTDTAGAYEHMGCSMDNFVQGTVYEMENEIINVPDALVNKRERPIGGALALTDAQKADTYRFAGRGDLQGHTVYIKKRTVVEWVTQARERALISVPDGGANDPVTVNARLYELYRRDVNEGFQQRFKIAANSEEFNLVAPIPHDFFNLNNHIGPGNKIDIQLTAYPDKFLLNTKLGDIESYRLEILDMKLHLRTIERRERIEPPLVERYRMNQTELHKQVVPLGLSRYAFRLHHGGCLPKTIVFAFNDTRAVEGTYDRNPLHFNHHSLTKIQLNINGETYPTNGLRFDFDKRNPECSWGYHWLFENTGCLLTNRGNMVTVNQFITGCFLVPFDLTPDKCNGVHNHKSVFGYIDVELEWARPLRNSLTVLYEKVYNKLVVNDKLNSQLSILDVDK